MPVNQKKGLVAITEKSILNQVWFKYFPYWPLFLLCLVLSIAGAWAYLRYETTPLYQSTATILIKDQKKGQNDSKLMESLDQLSTKKIMENEIEILRSRELMIEVVKKLHLYAPVYKEGKIKATPLYLSSPISVISRNPDSLIETDKVYFSYSSAKNQVIIHNKSYPLNEWVDTKYGRIKFIPQNTQSKGTDPLYFLLVNPKKIALSLIKRLNTSPASRLSSVINLKLKDEIPKRAEDILNGLIAGYSRAAVNDKNTLAVNTLAFVEERLSYVSHDLDSIEKKLQQYKSNRSAINITAQGELFLQNASTIDKQLGDVNMQLAVLNQVENYVKAKDNTGGIVPSTVGVTDPLLSQLLEKLNNSELQYEKLKTTTAKNNPLLVSVKDQIELIKPSILENIQSQKAGLEASKNNLYANNNRMASMLQTLPQKERDLVEISRQQNIKTSIYNFLLQKREEAALSLSSSITDSRVIDKAESSFEPVSPNRKLIYMIAILLAFALAVGIITVKDLLRRTILFRHEIEAYTSIPIIGEIIFEKSGDPIVIGNGKRTFIAEQFRNLRASLFYMGAKEERKKLLVTSTVAGEGKSFITANLGISLALAGKKVVLLEFDLSDPTLSEKLNVTNVNKGLTDYLSGQAEPEEIIRRTPVQENLFIMPAGSLPENPSELIMSEKVPELMKYLNDIFDYIIVDTAPVGLLSDAYVLSRYCDATLYVIRHRHTRRISVQRLDENNETNELKNMRLVFNGVRSRGFSKNGYGYGYGYGYIYNEKTKKKKKDSRCCRVNWTGCSIERNAQ